MAPVPLPRYSRGIICCCCTTLCLKGGHSRDQAFFFWRGPRVRRGLNPMPRDIPSKPSLLGLRGARVDIISGMAFPLTPASNGPYRTTFKNIAVEYKWYSHEPKNRMKQAPRMVHHKAVTRLNVRQSKRNTLVHKLGRMQHEPCTTQELDFPHAQFAPSFPDPLPGLEICCLSDTQCPGGRLRGSTYCNRNLAI